jgi:hypothetical protein
MHATMRYYSGPGAKELFDLLEARKGEVEAAMGKTPKLVSYTLIRLADAGVSVTVCHDKAGTDESVKLASAWIKENGGGIKANPPMVQEGAVIAHVK